jgi:ketosteroid isomerase-like protein
VYAKAKNLEDASPETTRKLASVKNLIGGVRDTQLAAADTSAKKPAETAAAAAASAPATTAKAEEKPAAAKGKKGAKPEAAKAEPAKAEPPKAEPAKAEPPKAEPAKAEPAKAETPKTELAKASDTPANPEPEAGKSFDPAAVEQAVRNWASAWAGKDVEGYLASYAPDFRAPAGGRAKWENARRERISKPETISIEIESLSIKQQKGKAVATFTQNYRSPIHKSNDNKILVLAQRDGEWRIVEERIGK